MPIPYNCLDDEKFCLMDHFAAMTVAKKRMEESVSILATGVGELQPMSNGI